MKPKHTKGPWKYTEDTEDLLAGREVVAMNIYAPDKLCGHVASVGALGMAANEIEANAHLIAAAPEMLEALENALAWIDRSHKYGSDMESSRLSCLLDASGILSDAIKKARGES